MAKWPDSVSIEGNHVCLELLDRRKLMSFCIFGYISALLVGCSPKSTENLEADQFSFNTYVHYMPATGEAIVSIDLEHDAFLSTSTSLGLGNSDSFLISSGENVINISAMPEGIISVPIMIDQTSELSLDFQRNGNSLKIITVTLDANIFPSIESDVSTLNADARQLTARLGYGISIPHTIERGFSFGFGSMPVRCYSEDTGLEETGSQSLLRGQYSSAEIFIPSPLDETNLNTKVNANRLIATQYQNLLISEFYEYCETQFYSVVHITKPFNSGTSGQTYTTEHVSYFEEGDFDGSLSIRLLSEPVALRIDRTSLIP